jgi:hypothetical protein
MCASILKSDLHPVKNLHKLCKSELRTILAVSTIKGGTARKSDTDQRVGRTLWTASILSPFFSPETFDLTRGALCAKKRPSIISSILNHINALCLVKQRQAKSYGLRGRFS